MPSRFAGRRPPRRHVCGARYIGQVRSCRVKDGKLFLSLMADGGFYVWQTCPE